MRDQIKAALENLISNHVRHTSGLNKAGATWLFVGAIGLHGLHDGWPKFFSAALLIVVAIYEFFKNYPYNLRQARKELAFLNAEIIYIPEDDHELISLAQKANDGLAVVRPILQSSIFMAALIYFLNIFVNQIFWAARHL
jgi:hypothetical protein